MRLGKSRFGGERNMSRFYLAQSPSRTFPPQGWLCSPTHTFSFSTFPLFYWLAFPFSPFPCSGAPALFSSSQPPSSFLTERFISVAQLHKGTEMLFPSPLPASFVFKSFFLPALTIQPQILKIPSQIPFALLDSPQIRKCHLMLQYLCWKQNK